LRNIKLVASGNPAYIGGLLEALPDGGFFFVAEDDPVDYFEEGAAAAFAYVVAVSRRTTADARRIWLE